MPLKSRILFESSVSKNAYDACDLIILLETTRALVTPDLFALILNECTDVCQYKRRSN